MRERPLPPQGDTVKTKPARRGAPKLAKSLGPHLARLAKASGAMDPRLASEWLEIAGPEIAALCRPTRVINRGRQQALEVSVTSGAAAMKLQYHQEALLGRVRQRIGLPRLNRLVIREGKETKGWASRRMKAAPPKVEPPKTAPESESLKSALDAMRQTIHERKR